MTTGLKCFKLSEDNNNNSAFFAYQVKKLYTLYCNEGRHYV
ncbi:hypothetical protein CMALT430_30028 [Carnobacterium maltaromaticum]|nr:hypothetical protein CMALT430_30028 [Carnobacterium maltaromaticum]CAD5901198.1 hypothetical protein CMALT394_310103 [Carnobacterium maltaromaticum]